MQGPSIVSNTSVVVWRVITGDIEGNLKMDNLISSARMFAIKSVLWFVSAYANFLLVTSLIKKGISNLRIMCLNGWGGKLHNNLIPYIRAASPDILCLQEVIHTPSTRKDWLMYKDGDHNLQQRANFFRDVVTSLPDHAATFCPAALGVLWDGNDAVPSQWGIATFVRNSFAVIGQIQAFVHKSFSPDGYGDHPRSRNAHAIRVFDHERNWPISIVHMHGLRDLNGKIDTPQRLAQARKLADLTNRVSEQHDRIVVCGDFNVEPGSATFSLLAELGLSELVTTRGFSSTRTSHYKKPGRFADYMFVNATVNILGFDVVAEPEVSDHCALVLDI
jgi:endonuclease/exonuclease/phosphatase family metal-dependent hydrolase